MRVLICCLTSAWSRQDGTLRSLSIRLEFLLLIIITRVSAQDLHARTRERVQWFIYQAPETWFGNSREAIVRKFGRPVAQSFRLNPNLQDSVVADSIFTLEYDSATFVVCALTAASHEFLVEASVSGSRYLRGSPLQLGTPLRTVRSYFGDSTRAPTTQLMYSCEWCENSGAGTGVALWFFDSRLVGIKWEYAPD